MLLIIIKKKWKRGWGEEINWKRGGGRVES